MRLNTFVCVMFLGLSILGTKMASATSENSQPDRSTIQELIRGQLSAFARNDAKGAYAYASPEIQRKFQNPEIFITMVKRGYRPVYQPREVSFGQIRATKNGPLQEVYVVGPDGNNWLALYSFSQGADGSWKISGCYLTKSKGFAA